MGASLWVFLLLSWESIRTFQTNPYIIIGSTRVPTWTTPLVMVVIVAALIPRTSTTGHLCAVAVGYLRRCLSCAPRCIGASPLFLAKADPHPVGLGYLKTLYPPEWALRWVENRFNLLARLPHYVSVDQKTYGRFGVLPTTNQGPGPAPTLLNTFGA
jgi:hypothetical protein